MAGNLLVSISQNERERAIYRSRRKFQTDMQSNLATAEDNDRVAETIEIPRNLLKMGFPSSQIAATTGLTVSEVEKL